MLGTVATRGVVVLGTEMHGRGSHLVGSHEEHAHTLGIGDRHPAHVLLRAVFLRHDVVLVLGLHGTLVDTRQTALLAVAVAVPRATSEPGELFHVAGHFRAQSYPRQDGTLGGRHHQRVAQDGTIGTNLEEVLHLPLLSASRGVEVMAGDIYHGTVLTQLKVQGLAADSGFHDSHLVPRPRLASVIVGGQTEEVEGEGLVEEARRPPLVTAQRACRLAEDSREGLARDAEGRTGLVHRELSRSRLVERFLGGRELEFLAGHLIAGLCP